MARSRDGRGGGTPPRHPEVLEPEDQTRALEAQIRGEVDMMVSTARRYPRSVEQFRKKLEAMTCMDEDAAKACTYALPRGGDVIFGPSVRFAELAQYCWQHVRAGGQPIGEDAKTVTCRGVAWDMETNTAWTVDIKRRILDRDGNRYNDDMIAMTMNAGNSVAARDAILHVIPASEWRPIWEKSRVVMQGKAETVTAQRQKIVETFTGLGARPDRMWKALGVQGPADLSLPQIAYLRGLYTAIREGQVTVEEAFPLPEDRSDDQAPSLVETGNAEDWKLASDIDAEFKRLGYLVAQQRQKMAEYKGRHPEMLAWLRTQGEPKPAVAETTAKVADTKAAPAETKPAAPATVAAPTVAEQTTERTLTAVADQMDQESRAVPAQPTLPVDPPAETKPAGQSRRDQARARLLGTLKPGQTF